MIRACSKLALAFAFTLAAAKRFSDEDSKNGEATAPASLEEQEATPASLADDLHLLKNQASPQAAPSLDELKKDDSKPAGSVKTAEDVKEEGGQDEKKDDDVKKDDSKPAGSVKTAEDEKKEEHDEKKDDAAVKKDADANAAGAANKGSSDGNREDDGNQEANKQVNEAKKEGNAGPGEDMLAAMMKSETDDLSQKSSFAVTKPDGTIFGVGPHGVHLSDSNTPTSDSYLAQQAAANPNSAAGQQWQSRLDNQKALAEREGQAAIAHDQYVQAEMEAPEQMVPLVQRS